MKRLIALLLALLLPLLSLAEAPLSIQTADTLDEVKAFVTVPKKRVVPDVQRGFIRYVSINPKDHTYSKDFWLAEDVDLTGALSNMQHFTEARIDAQFRACYSMALSYLGVDVTPAQMGPGTASPYDDVTGRFPHVQRVTYRDHEYDTMLSNYLTDDRFSPMVVQFRRGDGAVYSLLIAGYIPETGGCIVCDPAASTLGKGNIQCYRMAWHVMRKAVLHSDFYALFYESEVLGVYQWRLTE